MSDLDRTPSVAADLSALGGARPELLPLFAGHRHLRAVWQAVIEGRAGRAFADSSSRPSVARLELGCYAFFGGDPGGNGALRAIRPVRPPRELIYPDAGWRRRLLEVHGDLRDRPMESFSGRGLGRPSLSSMAADLPEGYRLEPLGADDTAQLDAELEPHGLQSYAGPRAFLDHGFGWGVLAAGILASAATSYARSRRSVEVAIATRPAHRGRGLATAVAARFCLDALDRGLEACWNASNPVSKRLARRLGFEPDGVCEVLYLDREPPGAGS